MNEDLSSLLHHVQQTRENVYSSNLTVAVKPSQWMSHASYNRGRVCGNQFIEASSASFFKAKTYVQSVPLIS